MRKDFSVLRMLFITACIMIVFCMCGAIFLFPKIWILYSWLTYIAINTSFLLFKVWRDKKPKAKLKKKQQIMLLKYVIDNYHKEHSDYYYSGLCFNLKHGIIDLFITLRHVRTSEIKLYIPSFTRKNCTLLAEKYDFEKPHPTNGYWWTLDNKEDASIPRLACLNALLQELEK